jgi:hypothetical protein
VCVCARKTRYHVTERALPASIGSSSRHYPHNNDDVEWMNNVWINIVLLSHPVYNSYTTFNTLLHNITHRHRHHYHYIIKRICWKFYGEHNSADFRILSIGLGFLQGVLTTHANVAISRNKKSQKRTATVLIVPLLLALEDATLFADPINLLLQKTRRRTNTVSRHSSLYQSSQSMFF